MTRRELLARSLPATLLSAAAFALLPGCEGGSSSGPDLAKVAPERQAEIDKANEASEKFAKEQAKKK